MATVTAAPARSRSLILLVTAAILLNYIDRGTLGVGGPLITTELGLSAKRFGIAVSAFFWVYAPIQLIIGRLCDRTCVYRLYGAGVALWALSTLATGFVGGLASLVMLRLALGLGESVAFPGSSKMIARHVPDSQRGFANSCVAAALAIGPAVGTFAGGLIMANYGWRAMFISFGLITLLWLLPWHLVAGPLARTGSAGREAPFPIGKLLDRPALWWMSGCHFAANFTFYFLLAWLPLYLANSLGYSIVQMTMLATIVYVSQGISALVSGWLSDHLVAGGRSEERVRRSLMLGAYVFSAVAILGIAMADTTEALLGWLILAGLSFGPTSVNLYAVAQMYAGPRAVGSWVGIQNAIGNCAGIIGPVATGIIVERTGSYVNAFIMTAVIGALGAIFTLLLPRIERIALD